MKPAKEGSRTTSKCRCLAPWRSISSSLCGWSWNRVNCQTHALKIYQIILPFLEKKETRNHKTIVIVYLRPQNKERKYFHTDRFNKKKQRLPPSNQNTVATYQTTLLFCNPATSKRAPPWKVRELWSVIQQFNVHVKERKIGEITQNKRAGWKFSVTGCAFNQL